MTSGCYHVLHVALACPAGLREGLGVGRMSAEDRMDGFVRQTDRLRDRPTER